MTEPTYNGPERRAPNIITSQAIERAVADGIKEAVSDPAVWEAAGKAMREQAQSAAGGWLIGGLRTVFNRFVWVAVIALGIYYLGGATALKAFMATQAGK